MPLVAVSPARAEPGVLDSIVITGPTALWRGYTYEFAVSGFDAELGAVPLAVESISWGAPSLPGAYAVEYSELGIVGTLDVMVTVPPADSVEVTPKITNVNHPILAEAAAFDENGLPVPEATFTWATSLGSIGSGGILLSTKPGFATVAATSGLATGANTYTVTNILPLSIALDESDVEMLGGVLSGSIEALYVTGLPVNACAWTVVVTWLDDPTGGYEMRASGVTDNFGHASFEFTTDVWPPGPYSVNANCHWRANNGYASASAQVVTPELPDAPELPEVPELPELPPL